MPPQLIIPPSNPPQLIDVAVVTGAEKALSRSARAAYLSPLELVGWAGGWDTVLVGGAWPLPNGWSGADDNRCKMPYFFCLFYTTDTS